MFLLTALNVAYVLNPLLVTIPEVSQDATPEEKAKVADLKKKRQEDDFVCRGQYTQHSVRPSLPSLHA